MDSRGRSLKRLSISRVASNTSWASIVTDRSVLRVRQRPIPLASQNQQVGKRIAPKRFDPCRPAAASPRQTVRARCLCAFGLHPDPAHHVVTRRTDFHRALRNIHVREFAKLVIHAGQLSLQHTQRLMRNSRYAPPCSVPRPSRTSV